MKRQSRTLDWHQVDRQPLDGLATDTEHEVLVRREAIPLIFVPGIMGSRLRRTGSDPDEDGEDGLPNLRWDASTHDGDVKFWMVRKYFWRGAARRKAMLVGRQFSAGFLEVDNDSPVGDGLRGIIPDYRQFLIDLRDRDWGALGRLFVFPVYAHGYNWTDSNENAARLLVERIDQVIREAREVAGLCEKVILITHSMGGLVARAASELLSARGKVLGIVHGVQPATGAAAAYWRMKAGFEGDWKASAVLGNEGPDVTPVLANLPGGLQLLPNRHHRTQAGEPDWLRIERDGQVLKSLPASDPYSEIYVHPAVTVPPPGEGPSDNAFWGLVDPALLDPDNAGPPADPQAAGKAAADDDDFNAIDRDNPPVDPWQQYLRMLDIAKAFHDKLGTAAHPHSFCLRGTGHGTADVVRLQVEPYLVRRSSYQTRGFFGYLRDEQGRKMRAVLQQPDGQGDGTVPLFSAGILHRDGKPPPGDADLPLEHQPAYEDGGAQVFTLNAIKALCELRFNERHG